MAADDKDWKSQVTPLAEPKRRHAAPPTPRLPTLSPIVDNYATFDINIAENKTVKARRPDVSHTLLRELASDRVRIDAQIDLHGLTRNQAHLRLLQFLQQARSMGHRTLLVIHGKGHHTDDGAGVLADEVLTTLCRGKGAPLVLAVTTAHRRWGGTGALVVKLVKAR